MNPEAILQARARQLAQIPPLLDAGSGLEVVEFVLADEHYALAATFVSGVETTAAITPLPGTPPFVLGLINVHGRLLSVVDLRRFLALPPGRPPEAPQVLILAGAANEFGILCDAIVGVRVLDPRTILANLPTLGERRARFSRGIDPRAMVVLDAAKLLSDRELVVAEEG